MPLNEESRRPPTWESGEAATQQADDLRPMVADWAEVYEDAERWVRWSARRRWPNFGANTQVWACSVASWELHGRRAA